MNMENTDTMNMENTDTMDYTSRNIFLLRKFGFDISSKDFIPKIFDRLMYLIDNDALDEKDISQEKCENNNIDDAYLRVFMEDPISVDYNDYGKKLNDRSSKINLPDGLTSKCKAAEFAENLVKNDDAFNIEYVMSKYNEFLNNPELNGNCSQNEIDHIKFIIRQLEKIGNSLKDSHNGTSHNGTLLPYVTTLEMMRQNGITNEFIEKYNDNLGYAIMLANMYGADTLKMISMWEQSKKETEKLRSKKVEILVDDLENKE